MNVFWRWPLSSLIGTLDWLRNEAAGRYDVRELGAFDGVKVMEFVPRDKLDASRKLEP